MKSFIRAAASTGIAAATLAAGLGLGPAAQAASVSADEPTVQIIIKSGNTWYSPGDYWAEYQGGNVSTPYRYYYNSYSSLEQAQRSAYRYRVLPKAGGWAQLKQQDSTHCLLATGGTLSTDSVCRDTAEANFRISNGVLENQQHGTFGAVYNDRRPTVSGVAYYRYIGRGTSPLLGDVSALQPAVEELTAPTGQASPGQTTDWIQASVPSSTNGAFTVTAPTGSKIVAADDSRGGSAAYTIAADGRSVQWTNEGTTWSNSFRAPKFKLQIDPDATPNTSLTGGTLAVTAGGTTRASGTYSVAVGDAAVAGGGVQADTSARVQLERGQSTEVPFAVKSTGDYRSAKFDVTLTAPSGTTFDADQTVAGQWRGGPTSNWSADDPTLQLTNVSITNGGKTLTGTFDSANSPSFSQDDGYGLRWLPKVTATNDTPAGAGNLGYEVAGSTSLGAVQVDSTTETTVPDLAGGGVEAAASDAVELERGVSKDVPFAIGSTGAYGSAKFDVSLTAPAGTTFEAGQTVAGQWRTSPTANWSGDDDTLKLTDVEISDAGKTLTGTFDSANSPAFGQAADFGLRWIAKVIADDDAAAGTGSMPYSITGSTSLGPIAVNSSTATTLAEDTRGPAAPSNLVGYFPENVKQWAHIKGDVAGNATVTIKQGDKLIQTGKANSLGKFDFSINPSAVGWGKQDFTVTQTIDEKVSDPATVSLDYAANTAPTFTNPAPNGTILSNGQTFTGTGVDGALLSVKGVGITTELGSTTLQGATTWSVEADPSITLPKGSYQLFVNQFTKGGKFNNAAVTTTVVANPAKPAAPSDLVGYFPENVKQWAHIKGDVAGNATVTIKQGDKLIQTGKANSLGNFDFSINPSAVGWGKQDFTVTQTIDEKVSDPATVSLDYAANTAPTFTNPAPNGTILSNGQTFTGTGVDGALLSVKGVGITTELGSTTLQGATTWSVEADPSITLPKGSYQLFVNQFTKGGKFNNAAVTTTVVSNAPMDLVGYFPENVKQWAHIKGDVAGNATVTIKQGDKVIQTGKANSLGKFDFSINPSAVGWGKQDFTVTQTIDEKVSDPATVSLDYAANTPPTIASPVQGEPIAATGQVFTGTAVDGAVLALHGAGITADLATTTLNGTTTWSMTSNAAVTLPAGSYQLFFHQFTKGGRFNQTAVNVKVAG